MVFVISNQNSQFGVNFGGPWNGKVWYIILNGKGWYIQ
jgi:hypothetical protein